MTLQELEQFFATAELPEQIQVDKATRITNVRNSVATDLLRAKNWKLDPENCPSIWHLRQLAKVLKGDQKK